MATNTCSCSCPPDKLFFGICEFTWCPFGGNSTSENTLLNKENIGEGLHTVTVLENDLPPTTKRFKGIAHRHRTGKRSSSDDWKEVQIYELAVCLGL